MVAGTPSAALGSGGQRAAVAADGEGLEAINAQLTRSMQNDLQAQLATALKGHYEVSVNQRSLDENF